MPAAGRTARIIIGLILIATVAIAVTGVLFASHPVSTSTASIPTATGFISILRGSATTGTLITFSPQNVTVIIGGPNANNTVKWTNNDDAGHTVTSQTIPKGATAFNSGVFTQGQIFIYTFTVPGVYYYVCTLHYWMHGTVTAIMYGANSSSTT